jgi:hypothetical protein
MCCKGFNTAILYRAVQNIPKYKCGKRGLAIDKTRIKGALYLSGNLVFYFFQRKFC